MKVKQCPVCKTPDLCVIACPFNRILDQMWQPVSETIDVAQDHEVIEIAFVDSPGMGGDRE